MLTKLQRALVIIVIAGLAEVSLPARAQTKPIVIHEIYQAGGATAPTTIESLWSMSDRIIEGTIRSATPADIIQAAGTAPPLIRTLYHVAIDESLRNTQPSQTGGFVDVMLPGGDRDAGDHLDRYVNAAMPTPQVNEDYILFLTRSRAISGAMEPTVGADGIFLVSGDTIVARGKSSLSKATAHLNRAAFIAILHQLGRGK